MSQSRPSTGRILFFVPFLLLTIVALVGISVATGGAADVTVDDVYSAILHRFFPDRYDPSGLIDVVVWDIRLPRIYAVPLIHGPAGCASLRQMNSFDVSGRVPHAPCMNLSEIDLDPVAIHHEYVDFQGIDFDYRGRDVFVYPPL